MQHVDEETCNTIVPHLCYLNVLEQVKIKVQTNNFDDNATVDDDGNDNDDEDHHRYNDDGGGGCFGHYKCFGQIYLL